MRSSSRAGFWAVALSAASVLLSSIGCGDPEIAFTEIKRIDETISERELKSYLSIIDELPNKKAPALPSPFLPAPSWSSNRTVKVNELLHEEKKTLEDAWSTTRLAKLLERNRALREALRRAEMTPEQFVGFTLAIGTAMARDAVREDLDLDKILKRGELILQRLGKDHRSFSALGDESAYHVLQQVAWLPIVDRVQRLKQIPVENVDLIRRHRDVLRHVIAGEMQRDPLASLANILNESSLPFEELPDVGTDEHILWHPDQAVIGNSMLPTAASGSSFTSEPAGTAKAEAARARD